MNRHDYIRHCLIEELNKEAEEKSEQDKESDNHHTTTGGWPIGVRLLKDDDE